MKPEVGKRYKNQNGEIFVVVICDIGLVLCRYSNREEWVPVENFAFESAG